MSRWFLLTFAIFMLGSLSGWERNEDQISSYLRPALKSSGGAARLDFGVPCEPWAEDVPFPHINAQPPPKGATGLTAVRQMFRNDTQVVITRDQFGIIRITIGRVSTAVLQTRIALLTLKPVERYNDFMAIEAIENTRAVKAAMHKLGLQLTGGVGGQIFTLPAKGLPHLPSSMRNVTMDQALDSVARTFADIVTYGMCTQRRGPRLFWVESY